MNKTYFTEGGKEIVVKPAINSSLLKCEFKLGGELPEALQGLFTSFAQAEAAINRYLTDKSSHGTRKAKQGV